MIKRFFTLLVLIFFIIMVLPVILKIEPVKELNPLAGKYVKDGPEELGSANLVTSVIVTYRGLDTLGEVAVLFIATAGVGFLLRRQKSDEDKKDPRAASEILKTGSEFLLPLILLFGTYIFVHGHLSPGGGFQGGVVIASGILLMILANNKMKINHLIMVLVESISGTAFVILGLLGLLLAGGFLDNRFMSLGEFGRLFSAGAIPLIYSLIGLKVGSELIGILNSMFGRSK